jgi:hypothetical protein
MGDRVRVQKFSTGKGFGLQKAQILV